MFMTSLPSFKSSYTIDKGFQYNSTDKVYWWLGIIGSLVLLTSGLAIVAGSIYIQIRDRQFYPVPAFFPPIFTLFALIHFITMFNLKPNIYLNEEYLFVDFFFKLRWARLDDIVAVKPVLVPSKKQSFVILFKEGLTPFHRIYGGIYGRSFHPGVYVGGSISGRDELERLMKRRLLLKSN
jgi:hypothetical protein